MTSATTNAVGQGPNNVEQGSGATESDFARFSNTQTRIDKLYSDYTQSLHEGSVDVYRIYEHAYNDYVNALQSIYTASNEHVNKVNQTYMERVNEAWGHSEDVDRCTDAYQELLSALQAFWYQAEAQESTTEAQHEFTKTIFESQTSPEHQQAYLDYIEKLQAILTQEKGQQHLKDAQENYLNLVDQVQNNIQRQLGQSYEEYLDVLRESWLQADIDKAVQSAYQNYVNSIREASDAALDIYKMSSAKLLEKLRDERKIL